MIRKLSVFFIMLAFSTSALAQSSSGKDFLETLINKVKAGTDSAYAMVAWSTDKNSKNYVPVDISDPDQFRFAKRLIKRISNYIKISDSFEILNSEKKESAEIVPIKFNSKKRSLLVEFELVKINNKFYLVDID